MLATQVDYCISCLEKLVSIPSPSGFCHQVMDFVEKEVATLGYPLERTQKGNGLVTIAGDKSGDALLLTAHLDTLGAMVRSIKADGKLRMTSVGGFTMHSIEGEYCQIHTRQGRVITGTILSTKPSVHVYADARSQERNEEAMEIRLDEWVSTKEEVEALGIAVGDYISFDPRFVLTPEGFIKTRHLDDKAGVAILLAFLHYLKTNQLENTIKQPIKIMFSTYEEVGHGSSYIPEGVSEVLAIDMGAMGDDLSCHEKQVSICVKDSSGPYDYHMVGELVEIAKAMKIDYALDVYPFYGSDASAALRGGANIKAALIGPGIHASHSMERTHQEALENTLNLLVGYATKS